MQSTYVDEILQNIGREDSQLYRRFISIIVAALKNQENILITYSKRDVPEAEKITGLVDFIISSILQVSISITNNQNQTRVPQNRRSKTIPRSAQRETTSIGTTYQEQRRVESQNSSNPSPFSTNIAVFESFHTYLDHKNIIDCCNKRSVVLNGVVCELMNPFILIGIVPDSIFLSHELINLFTYSFHIEDVPSSLRPPVTPFFQIFSSFTSSEKLHIFIDRDVNTYISELVMKLDLSPLITSYITGMTKMMLINALKEHAVLQGRQFIIPDDVQEIFPCLVAHKFQLPEFSSFAKCNEFVNSVIDKMPVPV